MNAVLELIGVYGLVW